MSTAHHIGVVALLEAGATVYSRSRRHASDDRPIGGVVIDTVTRPVLEDGEPTGEIVHLVEVLDPFEPDLARAFDTIDEADIDLEMMEPPNDGRLRKLVCRLDQAVAKKAGRQFDSRDARYQHIAGRLMGAIFQGARL